MGSRTVSIRIPCSDKRLTAGRLRELPCHGDSPPEDRLPDKLSLNIGLRYLYKADGFDIEHQEADRSGRGSCLSPMSRYGFRGY